MQKKYLYIHGLNSDINSRSQKDLAKLLPEVQGLGYDYSKKADHGFKMLCEQVEKNLEQAYKNQCVVKLLGSSLGGYWALNLAKKYDLACLAFNPVTYPDQQLRPVIGINQNIYTLEKYDLTSEILDSYKNYPLNHNLNIKPFLILGENDELIPYNIALKFWQTKAYCILTDDIHSIMDYSKFLHLMKIF